MLLKQVSVGVVVACTLSCSSEQPNLPSAPPPGPPTPGPVSISLVSGPTAPDTIEAIHGELLKIRLMRDGEPFVGEEAVFEGSILSARFAPVGSQAFQDTLIVTTDSDGIASARVRNAYLAGSVITKVKSPFGASVDAPFEVLPGQEVVVKIASGDTAVYVAALLQLRALSLDRGGNITVGSPVFESLAPAVLEVASDGKTIGLQLGSGYVVVQSGVHSDTALIGVPPEGVIAAQLKHFRGDDPIRMDVVVLNLDGSGMTSWAQSTNLADPFPTWDPTGTKIVFEDGGHNTRLAVAVGPGIAFSQLVESPPANLVSEEHAAVSADGEWTYFNARQPNNGWEIWRVRADGSDVGRIGPVINGDGGDVDPDPAPDGTRVVYHSDRIPGTGPTSIQVLLLSDSTVTDLGVFGQNAKWSPDGTVIGFTGPVGDGHLVLMNPDGSGLRVIAPASQRMDRFFDWSPDGRYIIVRNEDKIFQLVDVQTELVIPLPYSTDLRLPTWRP